MTTAEIAAPPVTRDVEDVLRERGLTRFHRKAIIVTGAAWTMMAFRWKRVSQIGRAHV